MQIVTAKTYYKTFTLLYLVFYNPSQFSIDDSRLTRFSKVTNILTSLLLADVVDQILIDLRPLLRKDVEQVILHVALDDNLVVAGDRAAAGKLLAEELGGHLEVDAEGLHSLDAVLRIHDILVWIRIRGSMLPTNGYGSRFGSGSCYFRH
jgi:hypothetical protein